MAWWHWACALPVVQRAREPAYLAMRLPPTHTTRPLATGESILAISIPSFVIYIVRQSIKAYPQGWPLTTASTTLASRGDKMTSQQTSASVNASQWRSPCPNNVWGLLTSLAFAELLFHLSTTLPTPILPPLTSILDDFSPPTPPPPHPPHPLPHFVVQRLWWSQSYFALMSIPQLSVL